MQLIRRQTALLALLTTGLGLPAQAETRTPRGTWQAHFPLRSGLHSIATRTKASCKLPLSPRSSLRSLRQFGRQNTVTGVSNLFLSGGSWCLADSPRGMPDTHLGHRSPDPLFRTIAIDSYAGSDPRIWERSSDHTTASLISGAAAERTSYARLAVQAPDPMPAASVPEPGMVSMLIGMGLTGGIVLTTWRGLRQLRD